MISGFRQSRWWGYALFALGLGLSGVSLFLALRELPVNALGSFSAQIYWPIALLLLGSILANIASKTIRWKILLGSLGEDRSFWQLLLGLMAGQLWNQLVVVRLGDISRAWLPGLQGKKKTFVFSTVIVEKLLDTLFYALLVSGLLLLTPLPAWLNFSLVIFIMAAVSAACLIILLVLRNRLDPEKVLAFLTWLPVPIRSRAKTSLSAVVELSEILRLRIFISIGLTVLIWFTALLNIYLGLQAMKIQLESPLETVTAILLLAIALQAGLSFPSGPLAIGVYELICMKSLQLFGINSAPAFGFGVFLHVATNLPLLIIGPVGAVYAWYQMTHPTPEQVGSLPVRDE